MCASPYPTYQRKSFTATSLRLAYKKVCVCVCACTGFPSFKLDFSNVVYKALFGPRFRVRRDCFDSLSDGRSYERCEGAGKTVLRWECELLYNQNRVCVVGSQLFRAAGKTETGFSKLIYIAFVTAWQSKGVHVRASGHPAHIGVAVRVLIGWFQLDLCFWLKMLLRRHLCVEAQIHYPLCFGRVRRWYMFP